MASGLLKLDGLHPDVRAAAQWAISWADYYGVPITVTSGMRSWADQDRLYRNFRQCVESGSFGKTRDCRFSRSSNIC